MATGPAEVPDSPKCDECGIDFARSQDASVHRQKEHYKPSPGIREAIDRIAREDRKLLEKLSEH